jgi:hypothetical protein
VPKRGTKEKRLTIMVSSTVYGIEELLDHHGSGPKTVCKRTEVGT